MGVLVAPRLISVRPAEFSRRWCALQDGVLSYYESERNAAPNGEIKAAEMVCLVSNPPHCHGYGWGHPKIMAAPHGHQGSQSSGGVGRKQRKKGREVMGAGGWGAALVGGSSRTPNVTPCWEDQLTAG